MPAVLPRLARWLGILALLVPVGSRAQDAPQFTNEQLQQMLAQIALYPDSLLSQVLMAATYPADVAEAAKWSKANPKQTGDAAVKAVESQPWDPSVQSLVAFPQVLAVMGEDPKWVQNLGDAFLAAPDKVMDQVQVLRKKAQDTGSLKTSEQQKVIVEPVPQGAPVTTTQIIKIEPANPQVVYVPAYNPTVVYGPWPYPAYPPYYYPPPGYVFGAALATGIAFGVGIGITNALWGGCNWGRGDVNINVNKYNNVNANRQLNANQTNFQHNAANRNGVPYRDSQSREKFDNRVGGAQDRQDYRGRDASRDTSRDASRAQAQQAMQQRGVDPAQGRQQLQGADRERAQAAARDTGRTREAAGGRGGDNAFSGAGNAGQARQQADRGNASRQSAQQHAGGGARPQAQGGGARAGGGAHAGGGARTGGGGARGGGGRGR